MPTPAPRVVAETDLKARLANPLRAAIGGIVLAGAEQVYMQIANAGPIMLGPVRLLWIASGIALIGTVMVLAKLFWPEE